jgi:hypothetical protein
MAIVGKEKPISIDPRFSGPPTRWSLGRLFPIVLLLWALTDIGLRFLPEDWIRIEPIQVATRLPGRHSPFAPNLNLRVNKVVGEQALLANLAPTEKMPALKFSTDQLGFRLTPGLTREQPPRVFVFKGDSFTFGGSLSDEDTFASALEGQLGVRVYNAGKFFTDVDGLKELNWLMGRLNAKHPTVICVYLESHKRRFLASYLSDVKAGATPSGWMGRIGSSLLGATRYTDYRDSALYGVRRYRAWWNISPVKILCIRAYKRLYNGEILPNEPRDRVTVRRLPNNEIVLLDPDKVQNYYTVPDEEIISRTGDYMEWMRDEFKAQGIDYWVVLLPDKESVYASQIMNLPSELTSNASSHLNYLNQLEIELASRGVKSVNALTVLRRTASEDWATGNLSYFREDHHWNPRGVARVATALTTALRAEGWRAGADEAQGSTVASRSSTTESTSR